MYFHFYFSCMCTCKQNHADACEPKTVNKYFNGPSLGYFLSEFDEIFNIGTKPVV